MKPKVYVESTIVSYLTARPSKDLVTAANQETTRLWWHQFREDFELYVSQVVLLEVGAGDPVAARERLSVLEEIPTLVMTRECVELSRRLLREGGLPRRAWRDTLHLAIAAFHQVDFVLTWNCRHIANAVFVPRFASIMSSRGYVSPVICTPPQLLGR